MAVRSASTRPVQGDPPTHRTTLLDLVVLLSRLTESEQQTVAMARALVASGKVQLTGSFKDCCDELFS